MTNIHNAGNRQVQACLYLGGNCPNADSVEPTVGDVSFASFLADSVTPRFPGFTVTTSLGYWKGEPETVRVLTLLSDDSDAFRASVRWIAEHYKTRFAQEAVIYTFREVQIAWDCWPHGPVKTYHTPGKGY